MSTVREHLGLLWLLRRGLMTSNPQYDKEWSMQAAQFVGVHLNELIELAGGADIEAWVRKDLPEIPADFPHRAPAPAGADTDLDRIMDAFKAEADADKLMPDGGMERLTAFDYFKRGWVIGSAADARDAGRYHTYEYRAGAELDAAVDAARAPSREAAPQAAAKNDEVLALHRQLAAETLRADQGWQRYESKNRECNDLRAALAQQSAERAAGGELPPLPDERAIRAGDSFPKVYALAYTADQMREYGRACRATGSGVAAVRDAARYRWLRDNSARQFEHPIVVDQKHMVGSGMRYIGPLMGKELDGKIDAARAAHPGDAPAGGKGAAS